jgi:hypothetical protein
VWIFYTSPSNDNTDDSHRDLDLAKLVTMKGVPQRVECFPQKLHAKKWRVMALLL